MGQNKKIMDLAKVLRSKIKRGRERMKDLETFIDNNTASSLHKQEYIEVKAKIEAWEDVLDLVEGFIE